MNNINIFLKTKRIKNNLTQKEASSLLEVDIKTIQNWEKDTIPQFYHFKNICKIYKMSMKELFDNIYEDFKEDDEIDKTLKYPFIPDKYNICFNELEQEMFLFYYDCLKKELDSDLMLITAYGRENYIHFTKKYNNILFTKYPVDEDENDVSFDYYGDERDLKNNEISVAGYKEEMEPTELGFLIYDEIELSKGELFNIQDMDEKYILYIILPRIISAKTYYINIEQIKFWDKYSGLYNYPYIKSYEVEDCGYLLQKTEYTWDDILDVFKEYYRLKERSKYELNQAIISTHLRLKEEDLKYFHTETELNRKYFLDYFVQVGFIEKIEDNMKEESYLKITDKFKMFIKFFISEYEKEEKRKEITKDLTVVEIRGKGQIIHIPSDYEIEKALKEYLNKN